MDPDILRLAQVLALLGMTAAGGVGLWAVVHFVRLFTRSRSLPAPRASGSAVIDEARFTRLEQAVDAIAVEVERIAEAQRFSARLLSERAPARLPEATRGGTATHE